MFYVVTAYDLHLPFIKNLRLWMNLVFSIVKASSKLLAQMFFENLIADIDSVTTEFIKYFTNLSVQQLNSKKYPDHWSIAQCMQHVIIVNNSYELLVTSIKENSYRTGWNSKIGVLANYFGKTILQNVHPDNERKIKTLPQWQPQQSGTIDEVVFKFVAHQQNFKQLIITSKDLIENKKVIHSPANRLIVYKLEDAFKMLVAHEQRHLNQAKSLLALQYAEKLVL